MLMMYASVGAFFLVAAGFVLVTLLIGKLVRPNRMYAKKLETYECKEEPVGQAWFNFNPRFYIVALVYIVFDVEIAFVYPIASVFKRWVDQGQGVFALLELLVFIAILLFGLAYVWVKGDLDWLKSLKPTDAKHLLPAEEQVPAGSEARSLVSTSAAATGEG